MSAPFSTIEEAIEDIRAGRMVIVCDDEDRENEGDLTVAAEFATPETINFMAREGRGLICLALTPGRCDELGLDLMAAKNESPFETAFTVSIEARDGVTTGISAADRARTIAVAVDPAASPRDLVQPGHVFPLKAKAGGVLERTGQTEAAVDLARLAGLTPAGVICEIMNDDGTMARVPDLEALLRAPRAEDDHRGGPDRLPPPSRPARRASGHDAAADRLRRVHGRRLPLPGRRQAPRRARQGRGRRARRRARARAFGVPDRRRLPLAALRLRRAARVGAGDDRGQRRGRAALPRPGGARDRPAQQAARVQPPGPGARHGRRQPRAGAAGRPARLRHRRADPRRPRALEHPDPHEQPEEDPRAGGLRAVGHRAGADRARAQPAQRGLPAREARPARPQPAPPGAAARRADGARRARARPRARPRRRRRRT